MTHIFGPGAAALVSLLLCTTASAQTAIDMESQLPGLYGTTEEGHLSGAIAACYLGTGNFQMLQDLMALDNWEIYEPFDDALAFATARVTMTLYDNGNICDVQMTDLTIRDMIETVAATYDAAGITDYELAEDDQGCRNALTTGEDGSSLVGRISSDGQDPVCAQGDGITGAAVRFERFY